MSHQKQWIKRTNFTDLGKENVTNEHNNEDINISGTARRIETGYLFLMFIY